MTDQITSKINRFRFLLTNCNLDCKQYQIEGVEFCLRNELDETNCHGVKGGIIADEMGLGKTIMMIGLMFSNIVSRTLVVLPPILIQQWYNEIYRTTGHKALIYHGSSKKKINIDQLRNSTIVLTSYSSISILKKNKKLALIHQVMWGRVIFDEAHHLRNKNTTRFLGCINIRAKNRWFVTGTPIHNRKEDFYSLCQALGLNSTFYKDVANLRQIQEQFILCRTKKSVGIILPEVNEKKYVICWKNKKEKEISEDIHSLLSISGVSVKKRGVYGNYILDGGPLIAFLRAKQSCIMPSLLDNVCMNNDDQKISTGSKVDAVVSTILTRKENGNGKIVFCQFREEIDYISNKLLEQGLRVFTMDGRIKGKKRLESLQTSADVLILQIQTGCEGLNLQNNYSEVYFVSPHWNPAIEDQAIARCHRIGQTKEVNVFKFIMNGFEKDEDSLKNPITLEKYIQHIQQVKRNISEEIILKK